jgi:serine O-acetyltransferase
MPMPSVEKLGEFVKILKAVIFPGYFGHLELTPRSMRYYVGAYLDRAFRILAEQIKRGFCFLCETTDHEKCSVCEEKALELSGKFLSRLPEIRHLLSTDVKAAFEGDPAAKDPGETIFCYPSIQALMHQRVAHELYCMDVPLIPRIITEMAHSSTGIDIHPGAKINESLFIDHGTGVVIGETSIIGKNVRIYQGVTLGAKSFPVDDKGNPIKGIPRHPIVEDDVVIYSGATVLGRIVLGRGSVIGGNVWVTKDVPPGSRILQSRPQQEQFDQGSGI